MLHLPNYITPQKQFENLRCFAVADLRESGLPDSLAFITLPDGLEDVGVEIQPAQAKRDAFRTAGSIVKLCKTFAREASVGV